MMVKLCPSCAVNSWEEPTKSFFWAYCVACACEWRSSRIYQFTTGLAVLLAIETLAIGYRVFRGRWPM